MMPQILDYRRTEPQPRRTIDWAFAIPLTILSLQMLGIVYFVVASFLDQD